MSAINVLIPAYQVEKYLSRCLESLLKQTFTDWEAIIVDDGSDDNTYNIIDMYRKRFNNIKAYHIQHIGLSEVRNLLISYSSSPYIFFLDADDYISPDTLLTMYRKALLYNAEIVQCQMVWTSEDDFPFERTTECSDVTVYNKEQALKAYNRTQEGPRCMSAGKLYRRKVFAGIEYPHDGRTIEDEWVAYKLIDNCKTFVTVNNKLYAYYINPNSIMRREFSLSRFDAIPAIKEAINFFSRKGLFSQVFRIEFRYLTILQQLYRDTEKNMPEETTRMTYLMNEYCRVLPIVLDNLSLNQELQTYLLNWKENPLSGEIYTYWYYVNKGLLP